MQDVQMTLPIGSVVRDRYTVEDLLGKGGFGAVYLVKDQRVRGNLFALKEVIDPNKEERARFTFECEVLKRLDHHSLPRVYRVFDDEKNNRAYMLMDYIEGPNLEILRQQQPEKRFSFPQVMTIMAPIVGAVTYLHRQHPPIIHRDIKPANIIVPNAGDAAVLVDFGIAKEYDQDSTTTAVRRCSPGYGAPEQYARGTNTRTDIYGLGATFYALLTGTVPADALYRMTQLGSKGSDPLEPVTQLAPNVPAPVAEAIHRAMAINSDDRFPSAEDFWQALNAHPVWEQPAAPVTPIPPAAAPAQREMAGPVTPASIAPTAAKTPIVSLYRSAQTLPPTSRRRGLLILFATLALLALLAGLVFGTSFWTTISHVDNPLATATPKLTHKATAVTTSTTHPTAAATPTTRPTAPSAASPTSAPTNYPPLAGRYDGTISDQLTSPPTNAQMSLSQIRQNGGNISGNFNVSSPLLGSNPFTGTVSTDKKIQFLVQSYAGLLPLLFNGTIQANGTMSGTYCSYQTQTRQCDDSSGHGTWSVSPPSPTSISTSPDILPASQQARKGSDG